MEEFFKKYADQLSEREALKIIDQNLCSSIEKYKVNDESYLFSLKKTAEMISDFVSAKEKVA